MESLRTPWGLQPPEEAIAAWGARGIQNPSFIDVPCDRQGLVGIRHEDFISWLKSEAWDWMQDVGPKLPGNECASDELHSGDYHMRISTNGSYGYLYIGAWVTEEAREAAAG